MDPVSQAALGAVVGQAVGHARLGYRAAVVGAVAGALPDIDVFFSVGGDYFDQLVMHRGITHSLLFAPVIGPLAAMAIWRWEAYRSTPEHSTDRRRLMAWAAVLTLALWSHPLLDLMTSYGTQLLLPLSNARFAINAMPIIDPAYTLILLGGLLLAGRRTWLRPQWAATATLLISCGYLGYAWSINSAAEREASRQLAASGITDAQVVAFPTLLQVHYRRLVARTPDRDLVGYLSMWQPCDVAWQSAPRQEHDPAIAHFLATREGRIFSWFTMGWIRYRVEHVADGLRLRVSDLRYGFDTDPDSSLFTVSVGMAEGGTLLSPVRPGSATVGDRSDRLAKLFEETYAPLCQLALVGAGGA